MSSKKALLVSNIPAPPIAMLLGRAGFAVETVAPEATLKREMHAYDIAIIVEDHGAESWQLCQRMKILSPAPIIVIGTDASPYSCARTLSAGADYFLRKPFGPQEFLARVRSLLQRRTPAAATKTPAGMFPSC